MLSYIRSSDLIKTVLKLLSVAALAYSGGCVDHTVGDMVGALGMLAMLLTVTGTTQDDIVKAVQKFAGLACAHYAPIVLATNPQLGAVLAAFGAGLPMATIPAFGTAAKTEAAAGAVTVKA